MSLWSTPTQQMVLAAGIIATLLITTARAAGIDCSGATASTSPLPLFPSELADGVNGPQQHCAHGSSYFGVDSSRRLYEAAFASRQVSLLGDVGSSYGAIPRGTCAATASHVFVMAGSNIVRFDRGGANDSQAVFVSEAAATIDSVALLPGNETVLFYTAGGAVKAAEISVVTTTIPETATPVVIVAADGQTWSKAAGAGSGMLCFANQSGSIFGVNVTTNAVGPLTFQAHGSGGSGGIGQLTALTTYGELILVSSYPYSLALLAPKTATTAAAGAVKWDVSGTSTAIGWYPNAAWVPAGGFLLWLASNPSGFSPVATALAVPPACAGAGNGTLPADLVSSAAPNATTPSPGATTTTTVAPLTSGAEALGAPFYLLATAAAFCAALVAL